jgi:phenylpropionate dioxygenase-like ring-hydroxylating dioxygenase large terminal subunit
MTKSPFLKDVWYYGLPGHQLKPGKTIAKTLLNEPVLFGRTQSGEVFAMRDACPHQAAPLSAGRFDGNKIECAFHGWTFDHTGQCVSIPSLADSKTFNTACLKAKSYPVREVQGNIWIYMASHDQPVTLKDVPQVPFFAERPYQAAYAMRFMSDIDHAVVGLLDPAHIAFVHRAWWWRSPATLKEVTKAFEPSLHGFTMQRHALEEQTLLYRLVGRDPQVEISFQLPGVRIEHISAAKHTVCSLTATTPISETETEVTTLLYTTMPWFPIFKPFALWFMHSFLAQDRHILAQQKTRLKDNPATMLIGDADAQARWYYRLKKEFALAESEGRPFVNPISAKTLRWRS